MSIGESFQRRTGSICRIANRVRCSDWVTENHSLVSENPLSTSICSNCGAWRRKTSYSRSVQKPITRSTPGAVVPGPVEQHDLPGRRQVRDVAVEVPLAALGLGRLGQRDHAGGARVEVLHEPLDRAALARRRPAPRTGSRAWCRCPAPSTGTSAARSAAGTSRPRRRRGRAARRRGSPRARSRPGRRRGRSGPGRRPCSSWRTLNPSRRRWSRYSRKFSRITAPVSARDVRSRDVLPRDRARVARCSSRRRRFPRCRAAG